MSLKLARIGFVSVVLLLLTVFGFNTYLSAGSQLLPAYCGNIGAQGYQDSLTQIPFSNVVVDRGTIVLVTTRSDEVNGDVSSVSGLLANPGPDGISLREALIATNNDPGVYTIRFAKTLMAAIIRVGSLPGTGLPPLIGGNVIINGDVDDDGSPDITVANAENTTYPFGFRLGSSGNTLHALKIQNFFVSVLLQPFSANIPSLTQSLATW